MIQVVPAIDLIEGRCVRLSQGDYARRTTYDAEPADMARRFADAGFCRIHVVDLDGAKASEPQNLRTLESMARLDGVEVEWGGGLKSEAALRDVFNAGATYAVVGSLAAREPRTFAGWLEDLDLSIEQLTDQLLPFGLSQVICTDISRDGMLQGPNAPLYTDLQACYPKVDFCVSGGIGSLDDIVQLDTLGLRRVIVGKALYEGRIDLRELVKLFS